MSQNVLPFSVTSNVISFFVAYKMYDRSDLNGYLLVLNKLVYFRFLRIIIRSVEYRRKNNILVIMINGSQ